MGNSSFRLDPRSFSGKFEISSRSFPAKTSKIAKNSSQDPPKPSAGASEIESGALQDGIFKRHYLKKALGEDHP